MGPTQAEDRCEWMGGWTSGTEWNPRACARDMGFSSKIQVSVIAQAWPQAAADQRAKQERLTAELTLMMLTSADGWALGKETRRGLRRRRLEWQPLVQPDTSLGLQRVLPSSWNHAHTRRSILYMTPSPEVSSVCVSCLYP